jgi:hypothetical protein
VLAVQAQLAARRGDKLACADAVARCRALIDELDMAGLAARLPEVEPRPARTTAPLPVAAPAPGLSLVRDGDVWAVTAGDRTFRLKDSLGLQYLARLVGEPDRELHALDLAGASEDVDLGDAGEMIDPEARRTYKRRLEELDAELEEAERFGDAVRAHRARAEREFLAEELARAVGLGGRERRTGSAAERARVAVTRRIRDAIKRISAEAPERGRHLDRSVRTGRFCSYQPG